MQSDCQVVKKESVKIQELQIKFTNEIMRVDMQKLQYLEVMADNEEEEIKDQAFPTVVPRRQDKDSRYVDAKDKDLRNLDEFDPYEEVEEEVKVRSQIT